MKQGDKYFVRIDRKVEDTKTDKETFDKHIEYVKKLAAQTELYAGGFAGVPGGMIIFAASDLASADSICKNDPVIAGGFYRYELEEWELLMTSPV
ncbi:MAG: YciI family protein [Elusimicrobiales bacterium]|nr:YciI family protein [Elusimicrobiales bacterium]